ncbi:MAG: copper chaperone PCu(A)C [Erythrobacter sp.]
MTMFQSTRRILGSITIASSLLIAGCAEEAPVEEEVVGVPGMTIENARMVLAPVAGNPAAIYFDLKYEGERGLAISRAEVADAASATLHDYGEYDFKVQMMEALPIPITKGTTVSFEPSAKHVMAFDVSPDLKPGDMAEVTLGVSGGGTHTFEAEVRAAGDER